MKTRLQYPSLRFLEERISALFQAMNLSPAFPGGGCDLIWPSEKIIDVILFGDGMRILLDSGRWPSSRSYRLWVLNREHYDVLRKIFPFRPDQLGVIPRTALVTSASKQKKFPSLKGDINFIFSGRPIPGKNLDLISEVAHEYQAAGIPVNLHVFGPAKTTAFAARLSSRDWRRAPVIHGDKEDRWTSVVTRNQVYINLGLELTDDFCVSCAEAEEAGWPVIVPDRGPYREITTGNKILIPPKLILQRNVNAIVRKISGDWKKLSGRISFSDNTLNLPEVISHKELIHFLQEKNLFVPLIRRAFSDGFPSESAEKLRSALEVF